MWDLGKASVHIAMPDDYSDDEITAIADWFAKILNDLDLEKESGKNLFDYNYKFKDEETLN